MGVVLFVDWILVVLFLAAYTSSLVIWIVLLASFIMLILSISINVFVKPRVEINLNLPPTAEKFQPICGEVIITNLNIFPVFSCVGLIEIYNTLTGELNHQKLKTALSPKGESRLKISFSSDTCGVLDVSIKNLKSLDSLNISRKRIDKSDHSPIMIMPEIHPCNQVENFIGTYSPDSDEFSNYVAGEDNSEILSMREYRQGDSLKSVHWKLSKRLNKLMVKLGSKPVDKAVAVFFEITHLGKSANVCAEAVISICQSLVDGGVCFDLYFTDKNGEIAKTNCVDEQSFLSCVTDILSAKKNEKNLFTEEIINLVSNGIKVLRISDYPINEDISQLCYDENAGQPNIFNENNIEKILAEFSF